MKRLAAIAIVFMIIASAFVSLSATPSFSLTPSPSQISIYIGPASVLADNSAYNCVYVQLLDSSGQPARAAQDTTIGLSSSYTYIGTVDPTITILKGSTYVSANFYSTFTPGTTTISASASGFSTVQASVTTIGPIPSGIAVYGCPYVLPSDGGSYEAIIVQLQDAGGSPARAPSGGVNVALSCSNTTVGTVDPFVLIPSGQTYAKATIQTSAAPGSATITAISPGYATNKVTITTQSISQTPYKLKIYVGSPRVLADKNDYKQIAVQLQDVFGNIANATADFVITVASSDVAVGTTTTQITIPQNSSFAVETLTTTYKAGTTTITAVGTNLLSDQESISTVGFIPSQLAVYCVPAKLPSDNATYQIIQVQLQDSQRRPAKDPQGDVIVNLFSSQPTIGDVSSTLVIPFGQTQAKGNFTVTNAPGSTAITAQSSGYITSQALITTYLIDYLPLHMELTASPKNVSNGDTVKVTAYVTANGYPVNGATLIYASSNGGKFLDATAKGNGYYETFFVAPNFAQATSCMITVNGSKPTYIDAQAITQIVVSPLAPEQSPMPVPTNPDAGLLILSITDSQGNPLNNTLVTSTSQPSGTTSLINMTNSAGTVAFQNVTAGSYTFKIIKDGHSQINQTIDYNGQRLELTIALLDNISSGSSRQSESNVQIIAVMAISIVIAAIAGITLMRRKQSTNLKKLKQLQKQLKNKPAT
jgi:hypothetical protein